MIAALLLLAQTVAAPAEPIRDLAALFSSDDYPMEALRASAEGAVEFRIAIDATGRVVGCDVVKGSGSDILDRTTCSIVLERAKFTPAHDASGRPVASSQVRRTRWQLPDQGHMSYTSFSAAVRLDVMPDGTVVSCKGEDDGRIVDYAAAKCPLQAVDLQSMIDRLGHRRAVISFRFEQAVDPLPLAVLTPRAADAVVLVSSAAHLDIAPDGSIAACKRIGDEAAGPNLCPRAPGQQFVVAAPGDVRPRGLSLRTLVIGQPVTP